MTAIPDNKAEFNPDGTPRRKYELLEGNGSKLAFHISLGFVLANALVLVKNVLFSKTAEHVEASSEGSNNTPSAAQPATSEGPITITSNEWENDTVDSVDQGASNKPSVINSTSYKGQSWPSDAKSASPFTGRPVHNDNIPLYGAPAGSAVVFHPSEGPTSGGVSAGSSAASAGSNSGSSDSGQDADDDDDGTPPPPRSNRLPIVSGLVSLGQLVVNTTAVLATLDFLWNARDPDGDALSIGKLTASSGTLEAGSGGNWIYVPALNDTSNVIFSYEITDGQGSVQQTAILDLVPRQEPAPFGTEGNDLIIGTPGSDVIDALGGNDTVLAREGNDVIFGGSGNDRIIAGEGNDIIYAGDGDDFVLGGSGDDSIYGETGNDTLFGEEGRDLLYGGDGNDVISGGNGSDILNGGNGNDLLHGDDGDDLIDGDAGDDEIHGGDDDDTISAGAGTNIVFGDAGNDRFLATVSHSSDTYIGGSGTNTYNASATKAALTINLRAGTATSADIGNATLVQIQNVVATTDGDDITGNDEDNRIEAGDGDDVVHAGDGDDKISTGAGTNIADGEAGDDEFLATRSQSSDTIVGGTGTNTFNASATEAALTIDLQAGMASSADIGTATLQQIQNVVGSSAGDLITGSDENNRIEAGAGDDEIHGGDGADTIIAGSGTNVAMGDGGDDEFIATKSNSDDTYIGGTGTNTFNASATEAALTIDLQAGTASSADIGTATLQQIQNVVGSSAGDLITGSDENNRIEAGAGDDEIHGGNGADTIIAGSGTNVVMGDGGDDEFIATKSNSDDTYIGGTGTNTFNASATEAALTIDLQADIASSADIGTATLQQIQNVVGSSAGDIITGSDENNRIEAGAGDDEIDAGSGDDVVDGGSGDDRLIASSGDGNDHLDGGDGTDTLDLHAVSVDTLIDLLTGNVTVGSEIDEIRSIENVTGGSANDVIIASEDVNTFLGGGGDDVFVFHTVAAIGNGAGLRDRILDFDVGDKIKLDDLIPQFEPSSSGTGSSQHFVLIRSDADFARPGEMRFKYEGFEDGPRPVVLEGNMDFDTDVEFQIEFVGDLDQYISMFASEYTWSDGNRGSNQL